MFNKGFEKVAVVLGALAGGALGGERDERNPDHKKHRAIGAVRGAASQLGMKAGQHLAAGESKVKAKDLNKAVGKSHAGALLGGLVAYQLAKKLGPKYDKEKNQKD